MVLGIGKSGCHIALLTDGLPRRATYLRNRQPPIFLIGTIKKAQYIIEQINRLLCEVNAITICKHCKYTNNYCKCNYMYKYFIVNFIFFKSLVILIYFYNIALPNYVECIMNPCP